MICREVWGAAPPGQGGRPHEIRGIMLHHPAAVLKDNREVAARLRSYQRYHQEQGWPDIAYHLGVDRYGHHFELRDHAIAGDTFTEYDPAGWFLILADGDFDQQEPTAEQLEGIAEAMAWAAVTFGAPLDGVAGHRDHAATSCPGDHLYRHLADGSLQARAQQLVDAGGVELREVCGQAGERLLDEIESGAA